MIKTKQVEIVIHNKDNDRLETEKIIKENKAAMAFLGLDDEPDQSDIRITPKK